KIEKNFLILTLEVSQILKNKMINSIKLPVYINFILNIPETMFFIPLQSKTVGITINNEDEELLIAWRLKCSKPLCKLDQIYLNIEIK
ncbi:MAG: hypothetical protein ACFFD1_01330, partial [Candidatus Thorarchaeota archaeon]